jgi:signal transduction histidine kinase
MLSHRMRSLETRFHDGIERMPDGFMLWDPEERLVAWNSRADRLMPEMIPFRVPGVRFADYIRGGGRVVFNDKTEAERAEIAAFRIARFREAGAPWEFRTDDGRIIEVEETRTASGGTVSIYRDVTAWRRQQEELEKALVAEREANLVHRRFIAMASHEFRTPLAVIDGAAQRVVGMAEKTPSKVDERMTRIREAVARMTRLMDRMLSSARLDEGRIAANKERMDLSALLSEAVGRQRQISAGFQIALRLPPEPIVIDGDPQLLEQVVSNLLSNAVKYSGRSRTVEVAAAWRGDDAPHVEIAVADHGVGIPADEVDHLFTRFFRARTATGISGTGIGLHLVRELVQLHGGRVRVVSQVARGSTFTVELPAGDAREAARDAA